MLGNGNRQPISYTDNNTFSTHSSTFSLKNVLVVPTLSCNLLGVCKFTSDNNVQLTLMLLVFQVRIYHIQIRGKA